VAWDSSRVVARDSSRVEAWGSSQVVAWDSSQVEAWDTTSIHLYGQSTLSAFFMCAVFVKSLRAKIEHLADKSTAKFCFDTTSKVVKNIIIKKDRTAHIELNQKELSYETYLKRGRLKADGIISKVLSHKKFKTIEVFEVEQRFEKSFVVKKGQTFSHGKTIKEAKESLKYKISSRDTSEFKKWNLKTVATQAKMIEAYRVITGACEFGVRDFCQGKKLPSKLSVAMVIELTNGKYGNEKFQEFFK